MLENLQIQSQEEILDPAKRKQIIDEIIGQENRRRKNEAFKRYEVYKDQTWKYVISNLVKQFDPATVDEMAYSISNLSIARKMVDKLARVYSFGVTREVVDESGAVNVQATKALEELVQEMDFNSAMKKVNRFLKLQRNCMAYVKPVKCYDDNGKEVYEIKVQALNPYLYDVIEDPNDREKPMIVILSNYLKNDLRTNVNLDAAKASPTRVPPVVKVVDGNMKDEMIADTPSDQNQPKNQFIFWSGKYHFTCDESGVIISGQEDGNLNPIGELPFENFAIDQDGSFWAIGGDDMADGSILLNCLLTHMSHVGIVQGYGQFYMKGKGLPTQVKLGPNKGIKMEYESGDPVPEAGFLTANPPLGDLRENLIMYIAVLLTTNNLSTSGIAATLSGSANLASGIAMVIDKAESMEDVTDQAQVFIDKEECIWDKVSKWQQVYKSRNLLAEEFAANMLPENPDIQMKFGDPRPIMSESEKLDNLKKRQDLGINSKLDLLMLDDPSLTKEQAAQKLAEIQQESKDRMASFSGFALNSGKPNPSQPDQNPEDQPQNQPME